MGYNYQTWETDDLNYDGFSQVATNANGTYNGQIYMQILPPTYTVQAVYTAVDYKF